MQLPLDEGAAKMQKTNQLVIRNAVQEPIFATGQQWFYQIIYLHNGFRAIIETENHNASYVKKKSFGFCLLCHDVIVAGMYK